MASLARCASTVARPASHHKIVVVGGGTAGLAVAAQLQRAFKGEGRALGNKDIAIVDPAQLHHYQPGWTLVGSGLKELSALSRPLPHLIPEGVELYPERVQAFDPEANKLSTVNGTSIGYDFLVVAPGLQSNWKNIEGLEAALQNKAEGVSSIYDINSVQKTWADISAFKSGKAIFTQPAGIIKCAGAPQKILWTAESTWRNNGVRSSIEPTFATGMPAMFAVPKYAKALEAIRQKRGVEGLFGHNLTAIDTSSKTATFTVGEGKKVTRSYDLLHVVPPQGPLDFVAKSPLADAAGWVAVNQATTQHVKYPNVFSLGDASSLPNSKTAAAITSQAPVLVDNLRAAMDGAELPGAYDGYASCPLLVGDQQLMLAEFKYGGIPKETFAPYLGSQDVPSRFYYHLKKDFFPWVYFENHVKGTWFGPQAYSRPVYYTKK